MRSRRLAEVDPDSVFCIDEGGRIYVVSPGRGEISVFSADGTLITKATLLVPSADGRLDVGTSPPERRTDTAGPEASRILREALIRPVDISAGSGGQVWLLGAGGEVAALARDGSPVAWFLTPGPEEPVRRAWAREVVEKGLRGVKWPDDIEGVDWPEEPPTAVLGVRIFAMDRAGRAGEGGGLPAGCTNSKTVADGGQAAALVYDVLLDASGYSRRIAAYGADGRPLTPFYGFRFDYKGRMHPNSGASAPLIFDDLALVPNRAGPRRELVVASAGKAGSVVLRWLDISASTFAMEVSHEATATGTDSGETWLVGADRSRTAYVASPLLADPRSTTAEVGSPPAAQVKPPARRTVIRAFHPSRGLEWEMELENAPTRQQIRVDAEGNVFALVAGSSRAQIIRWEARR